MEAATPTPQFVTAEIDSAGQPHTLTKLAALDCYVAEYVDGAGSKQVRICFHVPGSDTVYVLNEKVKSAQDRLATMATGWFKDQANKKIAEMFPLEKDGENGETPEDPDEVSSI